MKAVMILRIVFTACLVESCSARQPAPPPPLEVHAGQFSSARRCGDCHTEIYQVWASSVHATSLTNATFQASLKEVEDTAASAACIACHAPVTAHSDQKLDSAVAREGVTCDFCHSIRDIAALSNVSVDVGATKYGPVPNATSTGHQIQFSPLHAASEVCSGCHEFENGTGLKVLGTFTEWKSSDSAKAGVTCQRCHMPLSTMHVVDPRVKREPASFVNLHQMPGGHSKDQLSRALELRIAEIARRGSECVVKIAVGNKGAGHNVPTGMPTRHVVLVAEIVGSESGTQQQSRSYGVVVQDKNGKVLDHDSDVMLAGARFVSDTRLRPSERRVETFKFNIKPDENLEVRTRLAYRYAPLGSNELAVNIDFAERHQESVLQFNRERPAERKK
jgi:cytochrome c554/c'-like protein